MEIAAMLPTMLLEPTSLIFLLITIVLIYFFKRKIDYDVKHNTREPPIIPSKLPFFGHMFTFGKDPLNFLLQAYQRHGPVFTFIMLGKKFTYLCDTESISSFFNSKNDDLNAEEIYSRLVTPVFGTGVVYDVPHNIFMEQKKMIKNGLIQARYRVHVPIIERETLNFIQTHLLSNPQHKKATQMSKIHVHVLERMAELIIFTSSACLMGKEAREALTEEVAQWYTDLDGGFCIEAWLFPGWIPFPAFKRRDLAHSKIKALFLDIIQKRRLKMTQQQKSSEITPDNQENLPSSNKDYDSSDEGENENEPETDKTTDEDRDDMISTFMRSRYKDGRYTTDDEIAKLMISLLMAGQHTSSTTTSWLLLFLAKHQDLQEAIYQDIVDACELQDYGDMGQKAKREISTGGVCLKGLNLDYDILKRFDLLERCLKETLRLRPPLLTLMRMCKKGLAINSSRVGVDGATRKVGYFIPAGHQVCVSPTFTHHLTTYWTATSPIFDPDRHNNRRSENGGVASEVPSSTQTGAEINGMPEKSTFCRFNKKAFALGKDHSSNGVDHETKKAEPGNEVNTGKFSYFPFGAGRHRCVGESFAFVQIKTIVAVVLANFRVHLCRGNEGNPISTDDNRDPALSINYRTLISTPLYPEILLEPRWTHVAE